MQAFYGSLAILIWKCGETEAEEVEQRESPGKIFLKPFENREEKMRKTQ